MVVTHLERRKIEAGILVPMILAFRRAFGEDAVNAVAREVILALARQDGAGWAREFGSDLAAVDRVSRRWAAGGALDIERLPSSDDELQFNVTRCGYAEHFKALGLPELGHLFHCSRDFAMVEGLSADIALTRTQTIMEGASHCDFRFTRKAGRPARG